MKDRGAGLEADTTRVDDAPPSDVRLRTSLTGAELRAFLALPATQARIRQIVVTRLNGKAPGALIADLVQQANLAALTAKSPPKSMATATGWLGTLTARAVVNHFRRDAVHAKYLEPEVEIEELRSEPDEAPGFAARSGSSPTGSGRSPPEIRGRGRGRGRGRRLQILRGMRATHDDSKEEGPVLDSGTRPAMSPRTMR